MSEEKSERLGLRGRLAHFESALRLLGGANATGTLAAGAGFHAFATTPEMQSSLKWAALWFLIGIFGFAVGYVGLFVATEDIDHSLYKKDEPTWPEYLWWVPRKTADEHKTEAKREFIVALLCGLASFLCFMVGLSVLIIRVINLLLG
jgi:hypothetical protein